LGMGRGEEVYPLPDAANLWCMIALPEIAVSTPQAFRDWDNAVALRAPGQPRAAVTTGAKINPKLTSSDASDRITEFSRAVSAWLAVPQHKTGKALSGVSAGRGGRAGNPLLDLVHTGIENDFEQVVFPQHPELRDVKRVLEGAGAQYASLSGSGSTVYGLFPSKDAAQKGAQKLEASGTPAFATTTLPRREYWRKMFQ